MNPFESLETDRLILRRPRPGDAEAIFAGYAGDPEVTRYLIWPTHRSIEDTLEFVAFSDAEWQRWPAGPYLIHSRVDGALLGSTGLAFKVPERASTGYVLTKNAWGLGYATEALGAMVDLARRSGVQHLEAECHPDHRPSLHVLEKCGFQLEEEAGREIEFPNLDGGSLSQVLCFANMIETPKEASS